jgi:outer membrane protein OmpA-like peptidoglycan-associated protein
LARAIAQFSFVSLPRHIHAGRSGPLAPVGSNDNENGQAKNRRVELVKQ